MKKLLSLLIVSFLLVACSAQQPLAENAPPESQAFTPTPHATLNQVMRTAPFIHSNVIFDAQSMDPDARQAADKAAAASGTGATANYAGTYGGWTGVEESALAIAETANLIMIPGRVCSNGVPAPVEREDWKRFVQGLVDAGQAAYKAAQTQKYG